MPSVWLLHHVYTQDSQVICTEIHWHEDNQTIQNFKGERLQTLISFIPIDIFFRLDRVQKSTGEESRGKVKVDAMHLWIFV